MDLFFWTRIEIIKRKWCTFVNDKKKFGFSIYFPFLSSLLAAVLSERKITFQLLSVFSIFDEISVETFNWLTPFLGCYFHIWEFLTNSTLFCLLLLLLPRLRTGTSVAKKSFGISLFFGRQWKSKQILVKYNNT